MSRSKLIVCQRGGNAANVWLLTGMAARGLNLIGRGKGRLKWAPLASGWTEYRDLAAPQGATFQSQWRAKSGATT